jgi:phosphatidylserine decarboxylase
MKSQSGSQNVGSGKIPVDPSFPILKEGCPFILAPLTAGVVLLVIRVFSINSLMVILLSILGVLMIVFAFFCLFFFRNPRISITRGEGLILSPCNGTVLEIEENENEKIIRTFLSIFSVHLQRSPIAGTVKSVEHKDGKFLAAWNPEAHILNEQNIITIESEMRIFVVRQIAGFLARRCVSRVKAGDELGAGTMIGLIKFSSQVDLHLPPEAMITVKPGDKIRAGINIVGELKK